jgi:hypothetical protein
VKYALVFLCFVVAIAGCAKTSQAPATDSDAAKSFVAPADRGLVFLYRTGKAVGAANAIEVKVNGVTAGGTGPSTIFRWELKPGTYTFHSSTKEASATVSLEVKAGKTYFIEQSARLGFDSGRVNMKEIDEEKGKSMVTNMKLLVSAYVPE